MTSHYAKSKKFNETSHNRGLALLSVLIIILVVFIGFFYLIQANSLVGYSYEIREQKERLKKIKSESHNLELEITRLQSPINLEDLVKPLDLVKTGEVIYFDYEKSVAIKEQ